MSSGILIDFPVSCNQYRFVCSVRYLHISLSQNLWKYWMGVIFSALGGGELNFSPYKRSNKRRGSFFLHLYTRFALFYLDMLFFSWVTNLVLSFIHIFVCSLVIIFCFIVAVLIFFKFVLLLIITIFIFYIRHFWVWCRP